MHLTIELAAFWAVAFLTLCAAVVLLSIFDGLIENDLELQSVGKEAVIAGIASLIEAVGIWLVILFIPVAYRSLGMRALIIPALMVGLIYKMAHFDWSRYDAPLLLMFQFVIGCLGGCLFSGHVESALLILVGFGAFLAVFAAFARSLG
jgi:hypothetical protein